MAGFDLEPAKASAIRVRATRRRARGLPRCGPKRLEEGLRGVGPSANESGFSVPVLKPKYKKKRPIHVGGPAMIKRKSARQ